MNPQQPGVPQMPTPQQNPYDFILNNGQPKPTSKLTLPTGNSGLQRALILGGGLILLLILFMIFSSLLGGGGGNNDKLLTIAQDQTELIRIADLAKSEPTIRLSSTKALASNVSISLTTAKLKTLPLIKGKKVSEAQLNLKKSSKTDAQLATAAANDQYDSIYVGILKTKLKAYQAEVKALYSSTSGTKTRKVLADDYKGATILIDQQTAN